MPTADRRAGRVPHVGSNLVPAGRTEHGGRNEVMRVKNALKLAYGSLRLVVNL